MRRTDCIVMVRSAPQHPDLPARRSSGWPFFLRDFGKTDKIRLPSTSPGLATFSPSPPEPSPPGQETNPSSPRPETRTREERRMIYSTHSSLKRRDRHSEITSQLPTLSRAFSLTDLGGSQDSRNSRHRYSILTSLRARNNAPQNREEERFTRLKGVAPAGI